MLDSIHIARWIKQFEETEIEITIFPSTHFKSPHPQLFSTDQPSIRVIGLSFFGKYLGYVDSLLTFRFIDEHMGIFIRKFYLRLAIRIKQPDIIHAIEIQHAGYLVSSMAGGSERRILTNWGSDIYYYRHKPEHAEKIRKSLSWATDYSAECMRDYELALEYGFRGRNLPKIPNAGGFDTFDIQSKCSQRDLILVKSYGGEFGAGKIAINSIRSFLEEGHNFNVFFYSVTQDLLSEVKSLRREYPKRIGFSTLKKPISHNELMNLFRQARIYLGCSYSDGLSTSFLQALCTGAFPIQTNTSCADELISEGAVGRVIPVDQKFILSVLKEVIFDESVLNRAQEQNFEYSKLKLDANKISEVAKFFYFS
jgi:glycosyltransferase involved in cell wall biosynthesis